MANFINIIFLTREPPRALAKVSSDVVHAGPVIQAGRRQALVDIRLAQNAWNAK